MPALETERLVIRPFTLDDLGDIHQVMSLAFQHHFDAGDADARAERQRWLQWTVLNYEALAKLNQPPYGDRAIVLKSTGQLIGSIGFVPCLTAFGQLPSLRAEVGGGHDSTEFGLFWAVSPAHQRRGYATEAARVMIHYAFSALNLRRIIATTEYDNAGSMGVMRRVGMRIEKNPYPDPPWLQVVGILSFDCAARTLSGTQ
jgi:RimJ/RimL family protein N-acetyltransferase